MELLSKDYQQFYITSGVQFLVKDRRKAPTLSPGHYVELIFNAWKRSKRPTYPPTWEGLLTVLRKMDLGHLIEQITKCVTGSLPEIEDSSRPSESEVQLSPDKEQGTRCIAVLHCNDLVCIDLLVGESSVTELKAEIKRLRLKCERLEAKLTDKYDERVDQLEKGK